MWVVFLGMAGSKSEVGFVFSNWLAVECIVLLRRSLLSVLYFNKVKEK